jgi:hypothetical protein
MTLVPNVYAGMKNFSGSAPPSFSMSSEQVDLAPSPSWLRQKDIGQDLQSIFLFVTEKIRYEPYRGVLRGALGTVISGGGNSLDQSLLLGYLLKREGYRIRFVRGTLASKNVPVLLRGMYPPQIPALKIKSSLHPYNPESDPALSYVAKEHYWLEVNQGESWLPLDPSFPRAKAGEAYGKAKDFFDEIPDDAYQYVKITLKQQTSSGEMRSILSEKVNLSELSYRSISLLAVLVPQVKAAEEKESSSPMDTFGGSLAGGSGKKEKDQVVKSSDEVVGRKSQFALLIPGKGLIEKSVAMRKSDKKSWIKKEWLEFEIHSPGTPPLSIVRTLFEATNSNWEERPNSYRRFQIALLPGNVPQRLVKETRQKAKAIMEKTSKAEVKQLAGLGEEAPLDKVLNLESKTGQINLHMLLLHFAESSDVISSQASYRNGVVLSRGSPRILIASATDEEVEGNDKKLRLSLDLRYDEVTPFPFPGFPKNLALLSQLGRGLQESKLEGSVLKALTDQEVSTTAILFRKVQEEDINISVLTKENFGSFEPALPTNVSTLIGDALKKGKVVIIPDRFVAINGKKRWGWWEVTPENGKMVGVMDDGLHSAMAEYSIQSSRVQLNDAMGFVIGGMTGASSTLFTVSAMILRYGSVTEQMIKEVEQYLKSSLCFCPKAGASAEAGAGGSMSVKAGCFEKELLSFGKKGKVGAGVSVGSFCEAFVKGFQCASGMILAGMRGGAPTSPSVSVNAGFSANANAGVGVSCD